MQAQRGGKRIGQRVANSALEGCGVLSNTTLFPLEKDRYPLYRRVGGFRDRSWRRGKSRPHRNRPAPYESQYCLCYPGSLYITGSKLIWRSSTLNMKAVRSSETMAFTYKNIRCQTWEYYNMKNSCFDYVKTLKKTAFWYLVLCSCCKWKWWWWWWWWWWRLRNQIHHQCRYICKELHGVTTQKTAIIAVASVRTQKSYSCLC